MSIVKYSRREADHIADTEKSELLMNFRLKSIRLAAKVGLLVVHSHSVVLYKQPTTSDPVKEKTNQYRFRELSTSHRMLTTVELVKVRLAATVELAKVRLPMTAEATKVR